MKKLFTGLKKNKVKVAVGLSTFLTFRLLRLVFKRRLEKNFYNDARELFEGKTVILVGGLVGLNEEIARVVLQSGASLIILTRNTEKTSGVLESMDGGKENSQVIYMDFTDLESIKSQVEGEELSSIERVDYLLNLINIDVENLYTTKQGVEFVFGVNHLSQFYLTNLLFDKISACGGVVLNLSSEAHRDAVVDDYRYGLKTVTDTLKPIRYRRSQLSTLLFSNALQDEFTRLGCGAKSICVAIPEKRNVQKRAFLTLMSSMFGQTAGEAARPLLDSLMGDHEGGSYLLNGKKCNPHELSRNDTLKKYMWIKSEDLTGERFKR